MRARKGRCVKDASLTTPNPKTRSGFPNRAYHHPTCTRPHPPTHPNTYDSRAFSPSSWQPAATIPTLPDPTTRTRASSQYCTHVGRMETGAGSEGGGWAMW